MPNNFGELGWMVLIGLLSIIILIVKGYINYINKDNVYLREEIDALKKSYIELRDRISDNEKKVIDMLGKLKDDNQNGFQKIIDKINELKLHVVQDYVKKSECEHFIKGE